MQAMMGLIDAVAKSGLDDKIKMLVDLRASQINGVLRISRGSRGDVG